MEETDLYLPGKGGMDIEIKRNYVSSSTVNPVVYTTGTGYVDFPVYGYQKEGTDETRPFYFGSETHMRTVAENTIISCDDCLYNNSWEDYYDDIYYEWDSCDDGCT